MISLKRQRIAPPADPTRNGGRNLAPSEAERAGAPTLISKPAYLRQVSESEDNSASDNTEETEDAILRWFPVFLAGWGLLIIFLSFL